MINALGIAALAVIYFAGFVIEYRHSIRRNAQRIGHSGWFLSGGRRYGRYTLEMARRDARDAAITWPPRWIYRAAKTSGTRLIDLITPELPETPAQREKRIRDMEREAGINDQ